MAAFSHSPSIPGGFNDPNTPGPSSYSSSSASSQRPSMPSRTLSSSALSSATDSHPPSPVVRPSRGRDSPSDPSTPASRRPSTASAFSNLSLGASSTEAGGANPSGYSTQLTPKARASGAAERIKSRAPDSGWNWEAEKARMEQLSSSSSYSQQYQQHQYGGSSSMPAQQQQQQQRFSVGPGANPVAPPRFSSRPGGVPRSKGDPLSPGPQTLPGGYFSPPNRSRPASPTGRAGPSDTFNASTPREKDKAVAANRGQQLCDACQKPMTGQFVRALGVVFHLDCFRCRNCNKVVASKFFPATEDMGEASTDDDKKAATSTSAKLFPLCETDYFRRLDLLCAKCGSALRGSYITALGMKFHVEHFTCSICTTVFGPQDSYYEHDGRVFCHFHYSTRFAIRCTGCRTAILKQFVEVNRNNVDEHWHPECYMIHKFWNIKLCPTGMTPKDAGSIASEPTVAPSEPTSPNLSHGVAPVINASAADAPTAEAIEAEATETPSSLKQKQKMMEERVYRIWTVLSAFEESSAACISEMLKHVSNGRYLGGVRMAERFILHVEVLFAAIDDLEVEFRREGAKGISHVREARMLCKKIVNFFSLLSHTQETGAQRMGITQELLSLVTGLAHYLKILIRIALTGALRIDRDYGNQRAISRFLDQLSYLAEQAAMKDDDKSSNGQARSEVVPTGEISMQGPNGRWYGYRSLPRNTTTSATDGNDGATDLCVSCGQTVEEECVRMGISMRWHTSCLRCCQCNRRAQKESLRKSSENDGFDDSQILPITDFSLEISSKSRNPELQQGGKSSSRRYYATYCPEHAPSGCRAGFEKGTRLEQYAFLLRVALNRLYALLKKRGVVPASPPLEASRPGPAPSEITTTSMSSESYRDATDVKRMKSVNLDRKLSTKAKVPRISTVIGSPSGQQTHTSSMQRRSPTTGAENNTLGRASPRQENAFKLSSDSSPVGQNLRRSPSPSRLHPDRSRDVSPRDTEPGDVIPIRPAFARHNTDVRIRDDGPIRQASGDDKDPLAQGEENLTLADIPQLLEAEQAREQHRLMPLAGRLICELSALELFIVKHMAVMMLQQTALKDVVPLDDLIEFIEIRKNTFWGKLFKGGKDKKKIEKKGVFGVHLDMLVERNGADSTLGATSAQLRIPCFIDDIVSAMRQMDVSVEGIFRKNGNIRRLKELSEALDKDSSQVNLSDDNPVQLAALLKKFLRELPDPLMTFKLHRLFVMSQKIEPESERTRVLRLVTVLLPKSHRDTLEVLFVFLKWVASFSHVDEETGSKMDLQNLALVLGPNLLYAKNGDPAKDELFLANRAILSLLEHQDEFWMVPPELEVVLQDRELLNSSAELTSRDIMKRCEKYAKRTRSQGVPGPGGATMAGSGSSGGHNPGGPSQPRMYLDTAVRQPYYNDANGGAMRRGDSSSGNPLSPQPNGRYARSPMDTNEGNGNRGPWDQGGGLSSSQSQSHPHSFYGSPERSHYQHSSSSHLPLGAAAGHSGGLNGSSNGHGNGGGNYGMPTSASTSNQWQ